MTTGATRGDQVAILKGVAEGDTVVISGQLKLRNGVPAHHRQPVPVPTKRPGAEGRRPVTDSRRIPSHEVHRHIRAPSVLAAVVQPADLVIVLRAIGGLPVLQVSAAPTEAVVTVTNDPTMAPIPTSSRASSRTPLEQAIAQANGIDYMTSTSQSGVSTITVYLRLNY